VFPSGAAVLAVVVTVVTASSSFAEGVRPMPVIASFSILADLVRQVGGERARVSALVGPGIDMHAYRPSPSAVRRLAGARLVVVNGAGLEGWLDRLVAASGYRGPVTVATAGLALRPMGAAPSETGQDHHARASRHDGRGGFDPHAWQDPRLVPAMLENITAGLQSVDPAGGAYYARRAREYGRGVEAVYRMLRARIFRRKGRPPRVVVPHDGFAYLGAAYGIEMVPLARFGGEAEVSAGGLARILRALRGEEVDALLTENVSSPRLIRQLGAESGVRVGGPLFSDALSGPDGPAPNYLALVKHNAAVLIELLRP